MSVSTSSFDSEVGQDGVNIFDLTIDATSTACLDIADLMVSKDSKLMRTWIKSFDYLIDNLIPRQRASSPNRKISVTKNALRRSSGNPAKEQKGRMSKNIFMPRFNADFSASFDDTLADQSHELDYSTFSSYLDDTFVDQSHELDYSTCGSEELSSEYESFTSQSYDSEDEYLSESLDDIDELPIVNKKTRPRTRTMISITRAGRCVDQIQLGPFVDQSEREERRRALIAEKTHALVTMPSPSRSILTNDAELSLPIDSDVPSAIVQQSGSATENLDRISKILFSEEVTDSSSIHTSVTKQTLGIPEEASPNFDLTRWSWSGSKFISGDFPAPLVSHRLNALSKYNPFSSVLRILFLNVLKHIESSDSEDWPEAEDDKENEEPSAITYILSDVKAFELSIDEGRGCLSPYNVPSDNDYDYLDTHSDDASNDSDVTPRFCHHQKVSWSP